MNTALSSLVRGSRCICIVGAGGKTSLMLHLAQMLAAQGKRIAVITSTRIARTADFCMTREACAACWARGEYAVCGTPAAQEKLAAPDEAFLTWLHKHADVVLCEADGARHMACKAPAEPDPVILPACDLVIGVMGLDVLGGQIREVCHRPERVCALLGCEGEHRLTEEDMARILLSERGTRKQAKDRRYVVVLNKCEDEQRLEAGKRIAAQLDRGGVRQVMLTCLREGRIVWTQEN